MFTKIFVHSTFLILIAQNIIVGCSQDQSPLVYKKEIGVSFCVPIVSYDENKFISETDWDIMNEFLNKKDANMRSERTLGFKVSAGIINFKSAKKNHAYEILLHSPESTSTLQDFGAKGDGIADDTKAISEAFNSSVYLLRILRTKAYYKISDLILIDNVKNKKIILLGAKILCSNGKKACFLFENSKNIQVEGGTFGYFINPIANGGNNQHVMQFNKCQNVSLDNIHILNSPEMGIAITNSDQVIIKNSRIEHTFRDGTYAHYSSNVRYINNVYKNIKDDAMSFHDYGIVSEKLNLIKMGYKQSSNLIAEGNTVENAYQGFSSIGANNVRVINNIFRNTVLAGIAILNSKELYQNGTALSMNAQITGNRISTACGTVLINNNNYKNNGQASTGRAAIFIGSLGSNNQVNAGESKRLESILVSYNVVLNSKANGFFCNLTDGLKFNNNKFVNCSGEVPTQSISGDVVELTNIKNFLGYKNTIIDNRAIVLHRHGYTINDVTGKMGKWVVKGTRSGEKLLINNTPLIDNTK